MDTISIESKSLKLEFSRKTGALIGLFSTETDWAILNRREVGLSWRLMVPLGEECRHNDVLGEKQCMTSCEVKADRVIFIWDGVESEKGGRLNIKITMEVRIEDRQAVYYISIDNESPYLVENVYCPYLGGIQQPEDAQWLKTFSPSYAAATEYSMWPEFTNIPGYYGVEYPTLAEQRVSCCGAPMSPYYLIRCESQGLYIGIKGNSSELVAWFSELHPGWDSSINSLVPRQKEIAGKPVHIRFSVLHTPYVQPGESRKLTPVALEAYEGGWHQGVDIYKKWRATWMKPAVPPKWVQDPHAWNQLQINSAEDELRMRFSELPQYAQACKKCGVTAIQLVGWNNGGQDQNGPSHEPDPRLGTFEDLKEAIRKCHEIGVKIVLFTKFVWADRGTEWFRKQLREFAVKDPYGDYYMDPGYRYLTGSQLLNINVTRLVPMCFACEKYMQICEDEFQKVVDLGAAGMLFDECEHHGPALLCFDESHGHRYGDPVYKYDRDFVNRLWKTKGISSDFLMAGEACYDWEMEVYQISYHRSKSVGHIPLSRYMLPEAQFMTAVTGFNDRNMINQCLLYRYVISYEPYNFKGKITDYPDTIDYGTKMDVLRTQYRKWFWDGEFMDTCGATVQTLSGNAHHPYSVFKASDGSFGFAIANYDDYPVTVTAKANNNQMLTKYLVVDHTEWESTSGGIVIPPRSAVIVLS